MTVLPTINSSSSISSSLVFFLLLFLICWFFDVWGFCNSSNRSSRLCQNGRFYFPSVFLHVGSRKSFCKRHDFLWSKSRFWRSNNWLAIRWRQNVLNLWLDVLALKLGTKDYVLDLFLEGVCHQKGRIHSPRIYFDLMDIWLLFLIL